MDPQGYEDLLRQAEQMEALARHLSRADHRAMVLADAETCRRRAAWLRERRLVQEAGKTPSP